MRTTPFATALLLALTCTAAQADTITGRVVDAAGNGVPGVDIDARNLDTGDWETLVNDGTDVNGDFATTIPPGRYRLFFFPPPPPVTTHLTARIDEVIVLGTVNLGTIALSPGVAVSGRVLDVTAAPAANVNIDVVDELTGENLLLGPDTTSATGHFSVAAPAGPIQLELIARNAVPAPLASTILALSPTADVDLGDITLAPGLTVSGTVRDSFGSPVENADFDFIDAGTGEEIFTPGDNTDEFGVFNVVVPAGSYEVELCPLFADGLAASSSSHVVSADLNLGVLTLPPGFVLSGNVKDFNGANQVNADVDLYDSSTGASVLLCGDNTDANGNYAVRVPAGTFDIAFRPPPGSTNLGADLHAVVSITGNTTRHGVLPFCASGTTYGTGLAGSGGLIPSLGENGTPTASNGSYAWLLDDAVGGGFAILLAGTSSASIPIAAGTLLVGISPGSYVRLNLSLGGAPGVAGAGSAAVPLPIADVIGLTVFGQFAVLDAAAPKNWAMSPGFTVTFCP